MEKIVLKVTRAELQSEFEKIGYPVKELRFSLKCNKDGDFVYRTYNKDIADKILNNFPYRVTFSKKPYGKCNFEYKFVW